MSAVSPRGFYAVQPWQPIPGSVNPMELTERAFWQSRHNLRDPPKLTDLRALAIAVRIAFAFDNAGSPAKDLQ